MLVFILVLIIFSTIYNIIDNSRIKIVTQKITIDNLSDSFNGFTILQIGDLHGKKFGKEQSRLLDKINNSKYDMIAITGDMIDKNNKDINPFIEMLDGIKNKEYIFYTKGNSDLPDFDVQTKEKTSIGKLLEKNGCKIVDYPYAIKRGTDTMWVSGFFSTMAMNIVAKDMKPSDIKIALTHIPLEQEFFENMVPNYMPNYNLVLAGHYHGGQWRIPFYGAFFIPNANHYQLFPKQNEVSGLNEWGNYKQYVTRGLGASSNSGLFSFRLFNTPEINLITLVKGK